MADEQIKWGNDHLVFTFTFVRPANQGAQPLTSDGQPNSTALDPSAFGLTWNGEDQSTGAIIKRTGDGTWMTLPQTPGSATVGQVQYQVSGTDVRPDGIGPWNFDMEAYVTFLDGTQAISLNIQGPQILPRLPAS
jgi:hypothetical protein